MASLPDAAPIGSITLDPVSASLPLSCLARSMRSGTLPGATLIAAITVTARALTRSALIVISTGSISARTLARPCAGCAAFTPMLRTPAATVLTGGVGRVLAGALASAGKLPLTSVTAIRRMPVAPVAEGPARDVSAPARATAARDIAGTLIRVPVL